MALSDYPSLLIEAAEYSGRGDIAQHFDRFLRLAEAKLNRSLRVADMEVLGNVALVEGDGPLPTDFLEARDVVFPPNRPLRSVSLQVLSARYGTAGGVPQGYSIIGNIISVRPKWSGDLALTYYGAIPALSMQNPTNWLLTKAPDVYLYGLVEEVAIWSRDAAQVAAAQGLRVQAMAGLSHLDQRQRWSNARISIGGPTP